MNKIEQEYYGLDVDSEEDNAFIESGSPGNWREQVINVYSTMRVIAAQKLGLKWGTGRLTEDEWNDFKNNGIYDSFWNDVIIVCFLCIQATQKEIEDICVGRDNDGLLKAIRWADSVNLLLDDDSKKQAMVIFWQAVKNVRKSTGTYVDPFEDKEKKPRKRKNS